MPRQVTEKRVVKGVPRTNAFSWVVLHHFLGGKGTGQLVGVGGVRKRGHNNGKGMQAPPPPTPPPSLARWDGSSSSGKKRSDNHAGVTTIRRESETQLTGATLTVNKSTPSGGRAGTSDSNDEGGDT